MSSMPLISLISAAVYWIAGWFLFSGIKRLNTPADDRSSNKHSISVIIPARNEGLSLPRLLKCLASQTARIHEIIVVDDCSEDNTAEIAEAYRCKVISVHSKPDGWTGKSWACWTGALAANSDLLLFLDADVWCGKEAVMQLEGAYRSNGGLVSVQPKHETKKLYEQISAFFNIVSVAAAGTRGAFGPCIICSRNEYFALGGHSAIRTSVVDDFALARLFVKDGKKITPFLGGEQVMFRMYPGGLSDLYQGWTKNMAAGLSLSNPLSVVLLFFWFTGIINLVISVVTSAVHGQPALLLPAMGLYTLYVVQVAGLLAQVGHFRIFTALFFPLFLLVFLFFFSVSGILTTVVGKVKWKGRTIPLR